MFGPKRNEITKEWRRLHKEELHDVLTNYYSGDQFKKNGMGKACGTYGRLVRATQGFLVEGRPEGKRPLGRPGSGWEDNIKMNNQEMGCGGMDWIDLGRDRDRWRALVNTVINLRVI